MYHPTVTGKWGEKNKPSYTRAMTETDRVRPSSATIQYCTQVIIQIYTDTSVMYKNKDEQSKAIC